MQPELVADYPCRTGENPLWHPTEQCLYWTDIPAARLYRYDPAAGRTREFDTGAPVGGFTLHSDGALLLFMARGAVRLWQDGRFSGTVIEDLPEERDNRFNDVIADPEGRVFCGVMSTRERPGRLYRLDPDRSIRAVLENVGTSNGLGFTPDLRNLYFTDTRRRDISIFDYDRATGAISNRRVFVRVSDAEGGPDGLTVDAEGGVWSAQWDGYCIVRYSPQGRELMRVRFPARKVTSLAFGGPDFGELYVTTAGGDNRSENGPGAGALFRLRPGVRGRPEFASRLAAPPA